MKCLSDEEFVKYFNDYSQDIFRLAFSYLHRKDKAENIVQETFIKLYEKPPLKKENIKSWLSKVALNKTRDLLKKEKRNFKLESELLNQSQSDKKEDYELLTIALKELSSKYQIVIHLFYFANLSIEEISLQLHLSPSAVKKRLERARKMLREIMEEKMNA